MRTETEDRFILARRNPTRDCIKDADESHCSIPTQLVDSTMSTTPNVGLPPSGWGIFPAALSRFFNAVCDVGSCLYSALRSRVVSAWNTARDFGESREAISLGEVEIDHDALFN